jgi:hypothetical protein
LNIFSELALKDITLATSDAEPESELHFSYWSQSRVKILGIFLNFALFKPKKRGSEPEPQHFVFQKPEPGAASRRCGSATLLATVNNYS